MSHPPIGMHPGATWRKCDFQLHTPRDPQWKGTAIPAEDDAGWKARSDWARSLVLAAIAKGLNSIAVTDHHDLAMVEPAREALRALRAAGDVNDFWLFPGMEITCNDDAQCIILFDPETPMETMELLHGKFRNVPRPDYAAGKAPQAELCGRNIDDLMREVLQDTSLEPVSIMLPHGGDPGAYKSVIKDGHHDRFRNLPCEGFYCEADYKTLNRKTKAKLVGHDSFSTQWGERRRGVLPTSDNREPDFRNLGIHECWVRLGEPSTEAIRQALLADEARITYDPPVIPAQRIVRLEVDSILCGTGMTILLNDGLNTFVGGRGSGKSSLLEYLMFGIGRSALDIQQTDGETPRGAALLNATLSSGSVRVVIERGSGEEVWERTLRTRETIKVRRADGGEEDITVAEAQRRFQARGYRQKELSSTVSTARSAADQITGIAAAELIDDRRGNDARLDAAKLEVATGVGKLAELWNAKAVAERSKAKVDDLRRRYDSLATKLKEAGLSAVAQADMERAPSYARAEAYLTEMDRAIERTRERLAQAKVDTLASVALPEMPEEPDFQTIREVQKLAKEASVNINTFLDGAYNFLSQFASGLAAGKEAFEHANKVFAERVLAAKEQQREHSSLLEAARELTREIEAAETELRQAEQKVKDLEGATTAFQKARSNLAKALADKVQILGHAATRTNEQSGGALRASVTRNPISEARQAALLSLLDGTRVRGPQERIDELFLGWQDKEAEWGAACDRALRLFEMKTRLQLGGPTPVSPSDAEKKAVIDALGISISDNGASVVWQKLDGALITKMLVALPDLSVEFEYKDVTGDYMPFVKASPGQQAAALLRLLLAQEAGTLIIDQPEDDLDNKVIMEIVALLRTTKRKRQLIFATHNPNFVVNGDADKVVILSSGAEQPPQAGTTTAPRVSIQIDGAIETDGIREAITELMEGGRKAFELRSRKYDFV